MALHGAHRRYSVRLSRDVIAESSVWSRRAKRRGCLTWSGSRPLTLTNGRFSAFASLAVLLLANYSGRLRKKQGVLPRAHSGTSGAARTMKLFRTAFWLGVVIYNLPSPASMPAAFESKLNGSQGLAAKATSQFCPRPLEFCAKTGGRSSLRDTEMLSQDTLAPADRAVPWRGVAGPNPH
jgi:hypothetical protein